MFQSSNFFKHIDCPFFVHDECHRPYCHFKHVKSKKDKSATEKVTEAGDSSGLKNRPPEIVSGNTSNDGAEDAKNDSKDDSIEDVDEEILKIITQYKVQQVETTLKDVSQEFLKSLAAARTSPSPSEELNDDIIDIVMKYKSSQGPSSHDIVTDDILNIVKNISPSKLIEFTKRQQESVDLQVALDNVDKESKKRASKKSKHDRRTLENAQPVFYNDITGKSGLIDSFYSKEKVNVNITSGDLTTKSLGLTSKQTSSPGKKSICNCDDPECSGFREEIDNNKFKHTNVNLDEVEDEYMRRKMQRRLERKKRILGGQGTYTSDSPVSEAFFGMPGDASNPLVLSNEEESQSPSANAKDSDSVSPLKVPEPPSPPNNVGEEEDEELAKYIEKCKQEYHKKRKQKLNDDNKDDTSQEVETVDKDVASESKNIDVPIDDTRHSSKPGATANEGKVEVVGREEKASDGSDVVKKKKVSPDAESDISSKASSKSKSGEESCIDEGVSGREKSSKKKTKSTSSAREDTKEKDKERSISSSNKKKKEKKEVEEKDRDKAKVSKSDKSQESNGKVKEKKKEKMVERGREKEKSTDESSVKSTEKSSKKDVDKSVDRPRKEKEKSKREIKEDKTVGGEKIKIKDKDKKSKSSEKHTENSRDKEGDAKKDDNSIKKSKKEKEAKSCDDTTERSKTKTTDKGAKDEYKKIINKYNEKAVSGDESTEKKKSKKKRLSDGTRSAFDIIAIPSSDEEKNDVFSNDEQTNNNDSGEDDLPEVDIGQQWADDIPDLLDGEFDDLCSSDLSDPPAGQSKKRIALSNEEIHRKRVLPHTVKSLKMSYVSPGIAATSSSSKTNSSSSETSTPPQTQPPKKPTISPEDMYSTKKKRISHVKPSAVTEKEEDPRPKLVMDIGGKIPHVLRQKYFDKIIDELIPKMASNKEAYEKALVDELDAYKRSSRKPIYMSFCANIVKRVREMPDYVKPKEKPKPDPMKTAQPTTKTVRKDGVVSRKPTSNEQSAPSKAKVQPDPRLKIAKSDSRLKNSTIAGYQKVEVKSTIPKNSIKPVSSALLSAAGDKPPPPGKRERTNSLESEAPLELTEDNFYEHMKKYLLSKEELWEQKYPKRDPNNPTDALIKDYVPTNNSLKRICCRCGKEYFMNKKGKYVTKTECHFHWGKLLRQRGRNSGMSFTCCGSDNQAETCSMCRLHVTNKVGPLVNFASTENCENTDSKRKVFALDCEMCYTTNGLELTRLTVIDFDLEQIIDLFVKPSNPIVDYNTRFSGVRREDLENVTTTISDIHDILLNMVDKETILMGHSLESDLNALNLIHERVVDTAMVFPHRMGLPLKRALRTLMAEYCQKVIQSGEGGHDSCEDARSCMELMKYKFKEDMKSRKRLKTS